MRRHAGSSRGRRGGDGDDEGLAGVSRYARRMHSSGSDTPVGTELLVMALLAVAGVVGLVREDAALTIGLCMAVVGGYLALSFPKYVEKRVKAEQAKQAKKREEEEAAAKAKTAVAADGLPAEKPAAAAASPDGLPTDGLPTADQALALIRRRRSVFPKDFTGGRVPREKIEAMLGAAIWAPTHNLTEPWRFVVLEGGAKQRFEQLTQQVVASTSDDPEKAAKLARKAEATWPKVSHYIVIVMQRRPKANGSLNPEWEDMCAVAAAVQNLALAATALQVAGYWTSWQDVALQAPEVRQLLGLGDADRCLGVWVAGLSDRAGAYRGRRAPLEDKVAWLAE